jgi:hypothetical protein
MGITTGLTTPLAHRLAVIWDHAPPRPCEAPEIRRGRSSPVSRYGSKIRPEQFVQWAALMLEQSGRLSGNHQPWGARNLELTQTSYADNMMLLQVVTRSLGYVLLHRSATKCGGFETPHARDMTRDCQARQRSPQKPMPKYRLNLKAIELSLREVQREFPKINAELRSRRDSMTDEVLQNMMTGYDFVDWAVGDGTDLLDPRYVAGLLELNHIVLCGRDPNERREHRKHVQATAERFYTQAEFNIDGILRWYRDHKHESAWKRAAGVYVRILSQPQLYIEGNHRTGALIMSYVLTRDGKAPFVLTVENARAYFNPSTLIKETMKTTTTLLVKLPRMKKRFAHFLEGHANAQYLKMRAPLRG